MQIRSTDRESCPTMSRATWGTRSPTNPTRPDSATAVPPSIPADIIAIRRVELGLAPRFEAISSPRAKVLSLRDIKAASSNPTIINGKPDVKLDRYLPKVDKIKNELGVLEKVPLMDGIKRTIAFHTQKID